MKTRTFLLCLAISIFFFGCKDDEVDDCAAITCLNEGTCVDGTCDCAEGYAGETCDEIVGAKLIFKLRFDPTQERLDGFGRPSTVPSSNGAQSPDFNGMAAHYVELSPSALTQVGNGEVLFKNEETTAGGDNAIVFDKEVIVGNNETFLEVPLSSVAAGTYEYLRVSLAYQNYDIDFRATVGNTDYDLTGTLASFVGYNTYINSFKVKDSTVVVNGNKAQGYWAFETNNAFYPIPVETGQAPGTTVVNPLFNTSPIPSNSCLVTGTFDQPFVITGNETDDIEITVSLSTNKSFEWNDPNGNNLYEPLLGEFVVDMGLRGLKPIVN